MKACTINGELRAADAASISVMDHGLLYGDGVFEGLRFYNGKVFRMTEHLERLAASASAICLALPRTLEQLATTIDAAVVASGLSDGYIRVLITRGKGPLGINPATCTNPQEIIIVDELQMIDPASRARGARLIIASTRRTAPDQLDPRVKSMNYLNNILARIEANVAGADEAVMLNQRGFVAEGSADNIFIIKNGALATPPVTDGALAGITRATVMQAAMDDGIQVAETSLTALDLYTADACFLTGTGAELIPVAEISGRKLSVVGGDLFTRIERAFRKLTLQQD